MTEKAFGSVTAGCAYTEHRGAYLIAIESGQLHVLTKDGMTRLPGGDVTEHSSHEDAIRQSCMDATGFDVAVEDFVTDADLFDQATATHSTRTYYSGAFFEQIANPSDITYTHKQISLSDLDRLSLDIEKWAVRECIEMLRADAHGSDDEEL